MNVAARAVVMTIFIKICAIRHLSGNKKIGYERREQTIILKCDTFQKEKNLEHTRKKTRVRLESVNRVCIMIHVLRARSAWGYNKACHIY